MVVLFQNRRILYFSRFFDKMIIYSQPYDPMFPISKDRLQCHFLIPIYFLCFQSTFFVSNLITMFPMYVFGSNLLLSNLLFLIYIVSNVSFESSYYRFPSKLVSNLNSLFPMYFFCFLSHNHVYYQSTCYQSKYF